MINFGANLVMSIANKDAVAASLSKYKFIVSFDLFLTETSNFVDIILPDCSYLQSLDSRSNFPFIFSLPGGMGEWCWPIRQPVLPPDGEQRQFAEVLLELADRVGFRADLNAAYNAWLDLQPPYRLDRRQPLQLRGHLRRRAQEQFRRGARPRLVQGARRHQVEEEARGGLLAPVRRRARADLLGVPASRSAIRSPPSPSRAASRSRWNITSRCRISCPVARIAATKPGFDFYGFYYRDVVHTNSFTMENPWLDEAARLDPFSYAIAINRAEAGKRGFADGQQVWVESESGRKVKGRLKLTEGIHPEGLGFAAMCGHWTDGQPVAKGKGVFYNDLLELDLEHASPVNINLDLCVKVRVTPAEDAP